MQRGWPSYDRERPQDISDFLIPHVAKLHISGKGFVNKHDSDDELRASTALAWRCREIGVDEAPEIGPKLTEKGREAASANQVA